MSHSVADLLAKNPNLQLTESNKIKCSLTNHEMPPNAEAIVQYLNGKRFKKAKEWYNYDFSEFLPHIVPDRKNPMKLFCKLTKLSLNKIPEEVRKHVNGKKFQRLKIESETKKQKKTEKIDDDSSEDMWVPPTDVLEAGDDDDNDEEEEDEEEDGKKQRKSAASKVKLGVGVKGKMVSGKVVEEDTMSDLIGSDHDDDFMDQEGDDADADGEEFDFDTMMDDGDDDGDNDDDDVEGEDHSTGRDKKAKVASARGNQTGKANVSAQGQGAKRKTTEAAAKKKATQTNGKTKKAKK